MAKRCAKTRATLRSRSSQGPANCPANCSMHWWGKYPPEAGYDAVSLTAGEWIPGIQTTGAPNHSLSSSWITRYRKHCPKKIYIRCRNPEMDQWKGFVTPHMWPLLVMEIHTRSWFLSNPHWDRDAMGTKIFTFFSIQCIVIDPHLAIRSFVVVGTKAKWFKASVKHKGSLCYGIQYYLYLASFIK